MPTLTRVALLFLLTLLVFGKPSAKKTAVHDVKAVSLKSGQSLLFHLTALTPSKAFMVTAVLSQKIQKMGAFRVAIASKDGKSVSCDFKYSHNLCVLGKPGDELNVTVTCLEQQCKMDVVFSQRVLVTIGDSNDYKRKLAVPGEIYVLGQRNFNSILEVYSERDEYEVLSEEITVYSNVHAFPLRQTEELDSNSAIFGLKPISTPQEGYIFIDTKASKQGALKFSLKSHNGELRDGITVVDFIQNYGKHSHSSYHLVGALLKNMQANVRVFQPREPKGIPLTFRIKGKATQSAEQKTIRELKLQPVEFEGHNFFDFTFCITKTVLKPFQFFSVEVVLGEIEDRSIFFQVGVRDVDSFEVSIFQHVFFASEANELLGVVVEPQVKLQLSTGDRQIQILTNAQENYFLNVPSCSLHKGCTIEITTKSLCQNCSLSFELKDEDIKNSIVYYSVKGDSIEGQVELEEEIFFKYSMTGHSATKIIANSMNVMLYANFDNYPRCTLPSARCHQYAINQQNPMVVHNNQQTPAELILGVFGLEKTAFKVRFLNEGNGMVVNMGEKLSYLMDDEEKNLQLLLLLNAESIGDDGNIYFSLIAPLHSLKLTVSDKRQTKQSLQGSITFKPESIQNGITITIQKTSRYSDQFVHFTLSVSSSGMAVRLDPTITHYETYPPKSNKMFILQYDPAFVNALNIYTQNLQRERGTMALDISLLQGSDGAGKKIIASHKLMRDNEFIDLDADLQELDACDDSCELQISIRNDNEKGQFQQSLTLMAEEAVIGLDDSIWSTFELNQLSRGTHFYFIPRNQDQPITILFNTDDSLLSLAYRIHNTSKTINPQDWPFPTHTTQETQLHPANSQEIAIPANDSELNACWPTCVVLISLQQGKREVERDEAIIKTYKILATNSILELLEDTKLQFTLMNKQEKVLFIQAVKVLQHDKLTFFTSYATGRAKVTASLVSNDREYKLNGEKDFIFEEIETELQTYLISSIINREQLKEEAVLLKITIEAQANLKMTLEYTSLLRDIYRLRMDELEVVTLTKGEQVLYDFLPERDFTLKLYRAKGYPLFKVFKCTEDKYAECLSNQKLLFEAGMLEFLHTEEKVKKSLGQDDIVSNDVLQGNNSYPFEVFLEKSYQLVDEQCDKCVYFLWVYCFEGELQLSINLRTALSEMQLRENNVLNQRVDFQQHNKYLVSVAHDKDTIIMMNILDGAVKVVVSDATGTLQEHKINSIDNNFKEITIPADDDEGTDEESDGQEEEDVMGRPRNSRERRVFKHVHVTISGMSEGAAQYVISYSVGSSKLYLEDGIVIQKKMIPQIPHTFYYRNHNRRQHAYLTLSSEIMREYSLTDAKNTLSVNFYYYPDASDRNVKENFKPELPPSRNQNYLGATVTHVYELPSKYELYEIEVISPSYLLITASINHQEMVYLPLGFEYLIKLHNGEFLNLAVDNPETEYLEVRVKKCDESTPTLLYTNDAKEFKRGIFQAQVDIDSSNFHQYIKTKKASKTLHLRLIAGDEESLLTVSVSGSSRQLKAKSSAYRAGGKGNIDYTMIETNTAQVSFKPATCGPHCTANFSYFLAVSQTLQQIYGQLNCAGKYFVPEAAKAMSGIKTELLPVNEKHFNKESGQFRFRVKLSGEQTFIGVKAVDGKEEVLYVPVEIRSFWGEVGKVSGGLVMAGCLAGLVILVAVVGVSAKLARRGYRPISGEQ